jgi:hypothetical protein
MEVLRVNNFKGTNTEDENLSPNVLPFAYNIDTSKGRLSKRLGYASLVDIGSTGYPKGLHTAQLSSGDTLLVGADTSAYKLSGTASTEVVTTTADFNEGTLTNVVASGDSVTYTKEYEYDNDMVTGTYPSEVSEKSYSFVTPTKAYNIKYERQLQEETVSGDVSYVYVTVSGDTGELIYVMESVDNDVLNTTIRISGSEVYSEASSISGGDTRTVEIIVTESNISITRASTTLYSGSHNLQEASSFYSYGRGRYTYGQLNELWIVNNHDREYISQAIDIGQTPVQNTLSFSETNTANTYSLIYVRGSNDGITFGDWSIVNSSGDSIPLKRFLQVKVEFYSDGYNSDSGSLNDYTITYTTSFDTATQFDTGLTGNKIRWVNYQGQQNDGTGTATELKQYVYYCDGTSYKKYDGTTVTDITSSVVAPNIIYEHKGYMFFVPSGDETRLYYSDPYGADATDPLNAFEVTDATYYMQFPAKIKGLRTFQGKLVVSGDDFTSFVNGSIFGGTDDDTVVYQIDDKGVPNHESMAICSTNQGNILALVTKDGLVYLSGSEYENALEQKPLTTTVQSYINEGSFTNSYLKYHDGKLYFGFNSGVVPTDYVDSILVFNFRNQLTIDGVWDIGLNDMAVFNNRLYGSSSDTTNILELLSGQSDNGSDINMKAVIRFNFQNVKTTIQRVKIKATMGSDFTNCTSADLIVYNDSHGKTIDLMESNWRESQTHYAQFKGQDLMETKRSIKKRGTFVEATFAVESSYKFEIDSLEFEYKGVRQ